MSDEKDYFIGSDDVRAFKGWDAKLPPRGENSRAADLTTEQVKDIKRRARAGESCTKIGREYGKSATAVAKIRDGLTWSHVKLD